MDKIDFFDHNGNMCLFFERLDGEIHVEIAENVEAVCLDHDEVVRLRDFLTEWLNATP